MSWLWRNYAGDAILNDSGQVMSFTPSRRFLKDVLTKLKEIGPGYKVSRRV